MDDHQKKDLIIAAGLSVTAFVGFFLLYWGVQIQDVLELLEMAYG